MSTQPFVTTPVDYPKPMSVVGEEITTLASAIATGGYEIFLERGDEGTGAPPHSHPWDESFYVVKGDIDFGIGQDSRIATPGTLVHLPAGTVHWHRFGKGGGEMVALASRLGPSKMFAEIDREIAPGAPDLEKLAGMLARHQLTLAT